MEEKILIFKAKRNDQKAFNILFNKNWDYLYNYQLKRVGNNQIAEEISIETFAKAFDKLESFNNKYKFKTWLITISKNLHLDQLRKEKTKSFNQKLIIDNPSNILIDSNPSPEDVMILDQNLDQILITIKSLKNEYRQILQLRFFEDQSYKAISKIMNQPLNTIKVKILRAKKILAEKLKNE